MDSLLRSSKFLDLKKSFSSTQNNCENNMQVSYGLRSSSRNNVSTKKSVYSKFSNRTHGESEVDRELSINLTNRKTATHVVLGRNNDSVSSKADRFQTLNGNSRGAVDSSFHLQYSHVSPVNSAHEIHERIDNCKPQLQDGRKASIVSRMERDDDGFVIPSAAAIHRPQPRFAESNEEEERLAKVILSDLIDFLAPVEAFYYLKRYEEWLIHAKRKKTQGYNGLERDKSLRVKNWLHSNACEPHFGNRGWSREMVEDYASVSSRNTIHHHLNPWEHFKESGSQVAVFLLDNWGIIKGKGLMDLMVSGDLKDMKNQVLIEEGHITSRILSADSTIIKTSCCVYHLIGEFSDPNNSIPEDIKKYFVNSKFPKQWKEVVRKWNLIKQKQSIHCFSNNGSNICYGDRNEIDDTINNRKRRAPMNLESQGRKQVEIKKCRLEQPDITQTPMTGRGSNYSMITRSALRKIQTRSDYSFLGTPKSSKVYKKLKNRIKTPMPLKRIRDNEVISVDTNSI